MAEYNGYPSWNTWNVHLWISSNENLYNYCRKVVERLGMERAVNRLTQEFKGERTPDGARYNKRSIRLALRDIL